MIVFHCSCCDRMFQADDIWEGILVMRCPECRVQQAALWKKDEEPKAEYPVIEPSEYDVLCWGTVSQAEILQQRGVIWKNLPNVLHGVVRYNTPETFHYMVEQGCVPHREDFSLLADALKNRWRPGMLDALLPYLPPPPPDDEFYKRLAKKMTLRKMIFLSQHARTDEYGRYCKIDKLWKRLFDLDDDSACQKAAALLAGGANPGGKVDLKKLRIPPHCLIARCSASDPDDYYFDWTVEPEDLKYLKLPRNGATVVWPYLKSLRALPDDLRRFNLFHFWRLQICVLLLHNHLISQPPRAPGFLLHHRGLTIPVVEEGGLKRNLERLFAMDVDEAEAYCGLPASIWEKNLLDFVTKEYRQVFQKIKDFLSAPVYEVQVMWCLKQIPQDLKRLEELLKSGYEPAIPEEVYDEFHNPYFLTVDALNLLEKYGFDYRRSHGKILPEETSLLHYLAKMDMIPEIRKVLKKIPIDQRNECQETPLHYALWEDAIKGPQYLIQHGADVNCKEKNGASALHIAAGKSLRYHNGSRYYYPADLIKLLLEHNARLESRDKKGATPLLYAAMNSQFKNLQKLMKYGADINARNYRKKTALHILMEAYPYNDTLKCLRLLLSEGISVNAQDDRGNTALHAPFLECWKKKKDQQDQYEKYAVKALKILLAAGGDLSIANRRGDTPLHTVARAGGMRKLFKAMVDAGADPEAVNHRGETPYQILMKRKTVRAGDRSEI